MAHSAANPGVCGPSHLRHESKARRFVRPQPGQRQYAVYLARLPSRSATHRFFHVLTVRFIMNRSRNRWTKRRKGASHRGVTLIGAVQ